MIDTIIDKIAEWFNIHKKDAAYGPTLVKIKLGISARCWFLL